MKSRLSSPLVINYLLSLCKNGPSYQNKYLQVYKDLKITDGYTTNNRIFLPESRNEHKKLVIESVGIEKEQFGASEDVNQQVVKWINQYGNFHHIDMKQHALSKATSLLCNISVFKGVWKCRELPIMKVHNSFSYTDDIKYEARLIELPMQDDNIKLVMIVPNEVSSISGLYNKLVNEGMAAAVGCVQPLFTFSTALEAPCIEFSSKDEVYFNDSNCNVLNIAQLGNVQINENGTNISVVTLLNSMPGHSVSVDEEELTNESFHFAVLYKDVAIFTGRYVKRE